MEHSKVVVSWLLWFHGLISLTLQSLLFSISLLFSFSDFPCFFCAFFSPFPRISGVPRREKHLLFSGKNPCFFQKSKGWRVRVRRFPQITGLGASQPYSRAEFQEKALRAFPGSFRNFSGVSSGESQPYWAYGSERV